MIFGSNKEKTINKVIEVGIDLVDPNPHQPRRFFDEKELTNLSESIRQNGILQPLTVRKTDKRYELISGERRLRASKLAEMKTVPCIVIDISERNSAVLALVENIQRKDLSFFDEALAIAKLIDFYGMTQEDAAVKLGKAQSTIANKLRLLKFTEEEKQIISSYALTERHARALLKLEKAEDRIQIIESIIKYNLNVERTEKAVQSFLERTPKNTSSIFTRENYRTKDVRLFVNSINNAINTMQSAGINAKSSKRTENDYIEYVIRIPIENKSASLCAL